MPTYVLKSGESVSLPRRPLGVRAQATDSAAPVTLRAIGEDDLGNGLPDPSVVHPVPGLMVLPVVSHRSVIRLVPPPTRPRFAQPTIVHVSIGVEGGNDPDPERAVLEPTDISGLSHYDAAVLDVVDEGVRLVALGVSDEPELSELASLGRLYAREAVGALSVPRSQSVRVELAVDLSASMRRSVIDGSVAAMADLIAGVARVISTDRGLGLGLVGATPRRLSDVAADSVSAVLQDALLTEPLTSGFSSRAGISRQASDGARTLTYLITDAIPCDFDLLLAEQSQANVVTHLVVIGHTSAQQGRTDTGPRSTRIEPADRDRPLRERLLSSPQLVDRIVRSLLMASADAEPPATERSHR